MAEARQRDHWTHTAMGCMVLANINRDPKRRSRPFSIDDFMPRRFNPRPVEKKIEVSASEFVDALCGAFVPRSPKQ